MGPIKVGVRAEDLPSAITIEDGVGRVGSIRFLMAGGIVDDIWIEGLASGQVTVEAGRRTFSKVPDVASLKGILGDCAVVEGIIGGTYYNCANGLAVGVDVDGRVTQLRVRHR